MRYFLGIDIAKDSFDVALIDKEQKLLAKAKYPMGYEGFNEFAEFLQNYPKEELLLLCESTGIYHLNLLSFLLEKEYRCTLLNPMLVKAYIQSSTLRKSKTDAIDAKHIALFGLYHYPKLALATDELFSSIKLLLRERVALSQEVAKLKTEIQALVDQLFYELSKNYNIFTNSMLYLLLQAPSRKRIRNLKEQKIRRVLDTASQGKSTISAKEIRALAKRSVGISSKSLEAILQSKIRRLLALQEEIALLEEKIQEESKQNFDEDIDILSSIKVVGKTTAISFLGEVGDIAKFSSPKKLCAYIGTDPAIYQSGSSLHSFGKITKRGNRYLRRTLWLMALGVIRNTNTFKAYFTKKRSEGKSFKQAVIATANKLLRTIYALLKNKTKFIDNLHSQAVSAYTA